MKINKEWHLSHKMPVNATLEQRIVWHIEHARHCSCRKMPHNLLAELEKRKIKLRGNARNSQ